MQPSMSSLGEQSVVQDGGGAQTSSFPSMSVSSLGDLEDVVGNGINDGNGRHTLLSNGDQHGELQRHRPVRQMHRHDHNQLAGELLADTGTVNRNEGNEENSQTPVVCLPVATMHQNRSVQSNNNDNNVSFNANANAGSEFHGSTMNTLMADNGHVATVDAAAREAALQVVHHGISQAIRPTDEADLPVEGAPAKKRRLCRHPGCTKVIKSQGMCQRHGARAKRCKIEGCEKQAQGTHEGMCKRHWRELFYPNLSTPQNTQKAKSKGRRGKQHGAAVRPEGESVYDSVLPQSISYKPSSVQANKPVLISPDDDPFNPPRAPDHAGVMPIVAFLRDGTEREPGWHRNDERFARGTNLIDDMSTPLEPWERQLAMVEILLLSGGTPYANFSDLAYAWGKEVGFHLSLASNVCERRGDLERKAQSDAAVPVKHQAQQQQQQQDDSMAPVHIDIVNGGANPSSIAGAHYHQSHQQPQQQSHGYQQNQQHRQGHTDLHRIHAPSPGVPAQQTTQDMRISQQQQQQQRYDSQRQSQQMTHTQHSQGQVQQQQQHVGRHVPAHAAMPPNGFNGNIPARST